MLNKIGKVETERFLSQFSCPKNHDVEEFLKVKAIPFELAGKAKTYLVFAQDDDQIYGLFAYYTIAPQSINIDKKFTKNEKKRYLGTTYSLGDSINALLIGQLSKNYYNGLCINQSII